MKRQANQRSESVRFTYEWYCTFLDRLRADDYEVRSFGDALGNGDVVIRHDVDLSLEAALAMARIEAERDVQATYCVLVTSPLYNVLDAKWREHVDTIESLGHDVELHFSTHEYWRNGNRPTEAELERRVAEERAVLETVTSDPVDTVSFHIPPDWALGREFEGFRNTYAPAYFDQIEYIADSGQRWRDEPPTLDDDGPKQILVHPGLWGTEDGTFEERIEERASDACTHLNRKAQREFLDGVYD